ncbi:PEP/pyruvate-binding domain-containing protein [Pseudodesulfovibrio sp.]|uniref:PEP/pyruvate-binding domain-containing protein n=1 Tax=unclassified Pseudodesulfovibrio TaxID=2661612 RepID=UPI003B0091ED
MLKNMLDALRRPLKDFFGGHEPTREERAEIRKAFSARYNHFRLLIQANTRAHDAMGELEEALRGFHPYSMQYVRALCTRISTLIFQMIRHLDSLHPETYTRLFEVFQDIQERIQPHIEPETPPDIGQPSVLDLRQVGRGDVETCGPKVAMLGEAGNRLGLRIPQGFVITTAAYARVMRAGDLGEEINRLIQMTNSDDREGMYQLSSRIMQLIMSSPLPGELEADILAAYDALAARIGHQPKLAVRSSALGEDVEGATFAGQYRSLLNISRSGLLDAYREVLASKYSMQAMAYRMNRGLRDEDVAMSVGCMVMVSALAGGVAYSRSPVNIRDDRVSIHAVWGLPRAVVDGTAATDIFVVDRHEPMQLVERIVADKNEKYVCHEEEGVCRGDMLDEERTTPSLTDEQAVKVARRAVSIEEYFGTPQDIEWAVTPDGAFHLLQCRPLMLVGNGEAPVHRLSDLPEPLLAGGRTASPGVGVGPVHVVLKSADALTFPDGGVLILRQARPSRAALLDRCSAVISEQGGIAGHLANVAREFGVPALFGVEGAVQSVKNGQIVTVDADGRAFYAGAVEALLTEKPKERIMRGSPVQAALRKAARHIVRLNLTDPDSPRFRPSECRTLHDIMRFCHEMAVREMFEYGTQDDVVQSASRQLICDVPKQFWVLNLDDGFTEAGAARTDRCIGLEEIDSFPLRKLWAGMHAVPWEGPPPVHTGGLMSVMFEATMNPNLTVGGGTKYTQKNYFMVSKNYCSLQSRFGFHFCGVESLVGDRISENYCSFQFKGGAANLERRIRRARFVGEFLEGFDFRARVREDNLFARVEGMDRKTMGHRLQVVGYLITHTRQLDMIMSSSAEVEKRRQQFLADIAKFDNPA